MNLMSLLTLKNVCKYFGSLGALENINLVIEKNEFVGLVGPNGAGKTTLFNVISGLYAPTKGQITFDKIRIDGLRSDQIASMGLIRTFQSNVCYRKTTVFENVLRGSHLMSRTGILQIFLKTPLYINEEKRMASHAEEIIDYFGLSSVRHKLAGELDHSDQRRLGLAIAVAAKPKILLVDEPVAGMNVQERERFIEQIGKLHKRDMTIILVEHHVKTVCTLCKRIIVLDFGHLIADGEPREVLRKKEVIEAYLGTEEVI